MESEKPLEQPDLVAGGRKKKSPRKSKTSKRRSRRSKRSPRSKRSKRSPKKSKRSRKGRKSPRHARPGSKPRGRFPAAVIVKNTPANIVAAAAAASPSAAQLPAASQQATVEAIKNEITDRVVNETGSAPAPGLLSSAGSAIANAIGAVLSPLNALVPEQEENLGS